MAVRVPKDKRECAYCGKQFKPRSAGHKYDSEECARAARIENNKGKVSNLMCLRCGETFSAVYGSSRSYCDACRDIAYKERRQEKRLFMGTKRKRKRREKSAEKMRPANFMVKEERWKPVCDDPKQDPCYIPVREDKPAGKARLKVDPMALRKPTIAASKAPVEKRPAIVYEDPMAPFRKGSVLKNTGTEFTEEEDRLIEEMAGRGETYTAIAMAMGRTPMEIKFRHDKIGKTG